MSECVIHPGPRRGDYAAVQVGPKQEYAHRLAYIEAYGEIPEGHLVHHRCENKLCVNPEHLEAVTHAQHEQIHLPTACRRGHPFSEENTWVEKNGHRHCRTCRREALRRWRAAA